MNRIIKFQGRTLGLVLFSIVACLTSTFAQRANTADAVPTKATTSSGENVDQPFEIGPSDVLQISVWNEPQLSATATVKPDGTISLPLLNDLSVGGLTTSELRVALQEKYKTYVTSPRISVTVSEIHSRKVFITGEIARPGSYPLLTPTTVLQLIAQAGGFTPFSKRNKVFVLRSEAGRESRLVFNYSKVTRGDDGAQNITLQPGDTVVVP